MVVPGGAGGPDGHGVVDEAPAVESLLSTPAARSYARIRRELVPHFDSLVGCQSTPELRRHRVYRKLESSIDEILLTVDEGGEAKGRGSRDRYRVVAWNLERGIEIDRQLEVLRAHPYIRDADVFLLTEVDVGMARSNNRAIAQEIARELGLNYVFAPCYLNLSKGSGVEYDARGQNQYGLHGNAILSRYPVESSQAIRLVNGKDKMRGREKRLGQQTAVTTIVRFPQGPVQFVSVHLDAQSTQRHRHNQMMDILKQLAPGPAIIGGDWNTTTHNSSSAFPAIMGYWLRVLMGIDRSISHYLHPYRWFERELFTLLESHGFNFREANLLGEHTMSYQVANEKTRKNLGEWVPGWCFTFIKWALRNHSGRCPLRVDWLATRGVGVFEPRVFHEFREGLERPLSDHDAIALEIHLAPASESPTGTSASDGHSRPASGQWAPT